MAYGSLDEWFGKHVGMEIAQFGEESRRVSAVLEGADQRGLVVSYHGSDLVHKHVFFPWQNVRWIQLEGEGQVQGEAGEMGPGMGDS